MHPLVSAGSVDRYLEIMAWLTALFILGGLAVAIAVLKYKGIDYDQRRNLYAIRPQLMEATPSTTIIRDSTPSSELIPRVRDELTGKDALGGEPTLRETVLTLAVTVRAGLPNAPRLALRGGLEGAVILVAGIIIWASMAWLEWLRTPESGIPGRDAAGAVLGALPYWDVIGALALAAVVIGWQTLVSHWFVFGLLLVIGAVVLTGIDRHTKEDLSVTLFPDRKVVAVVAVVGLVGVYAAAALPNILLSSLGFSGAGALAGGLLGFVAALIVIANALDSLRYALVDRQSYPESHTELVALYLLIRKSFGVLALLSIPLAVYLVGRASVDLGSRAVANPLLAALVFVIVFSAVVLVLHILFRAVVDDVFDALARTFRSTQVRGFLFARGIPVTAVAMTFLVAWAFGLQMSFGDIPVLSSLAGLVPTLTAALVVGGIVRLITMGWAAAKYRFVRFEDSNGRSNVPVALYPPIEDADGDVVYVARVGSHELAHRDPEALAEDIATVAEAKLDEKRLLGRVFYARVSERVPVTFSRYYWLDLRFGTVDIEQVRKELSGDVRSRMLATIDENDGVDCDVIDVELAQKYPTWAVEWAKAQEMRRGNISRQDGEYVMHR